MMDLIDIHLGRRLRRRRRILGLTQQQLAGACGVRFQQIQKYECAANRMSAARLWQIAEVLEVPVSYFYEGLGETLEMPGSNLPRESMQDFLLTPEGIELAAVFPKIAKGKVRRKILDLVRAMAGEPDAV